jgi:hypothetical protein
MEIWVPNPERNGLTFHSGYSEDGTEVFALHSQTILPLTNGVLGRAFLTGQPIVCNTDQDQGGVVRSAKLLHMAVVPVIERGYCKAVVALFT